MKITDSYLEPEVRDGFYVPSIVKQAWAAELKVLGEIDKICKKHNIAYFADWGTLLGTVRHGGFIPWDDDLDITMKRADYIRFLQVAEKELPEGFEIFTYDRHPDFWSFMARVVARKKICFDKEHLDHFYGFPYIVGVDIFVLDYASWDEQKNEDRNKMARYVIAAADEIAEGRLAGEKANRELDRIQTLFHVKIDRRDDLRLLRIQLYRLAEDLFAEFSEQESNMLTRMMPHELYRPEKLRLPKEYYEKQIWLPFENILVPVPCGYDEMLRQRYGQYMNINRAGGAHDYPFFETQKKQLQAVLDFEMPGYRYTGIVSRDEKRGWEKSLKAIVMQIYHKLENCYHMLCEQNNLQIEILQESQGLAIEMGTLIEQVKGEGHSTVHILEEYCEQIFELSQSETRENLDNLQEALLRLEKSLQKEILERKTVVFLPYKAEQWEYIQSVWQAAMADEKTDVYVIPIPYFYKEYDGELRDMQYEAEQFPSNLNIMSYDEFDFELHYPEMIFIQNPYDEFDPVISVHRFFYSTNLKNYTKQLVYIPPFVVDEFSKQDYRQYYNMKYYCTVPGVVNADRVFVQSENMKQLYVEKLSLFAGEDTRHIWEEKIQGLGSPKADLENQTDGNMEKVLWEWRTFIQRQDGTEKKVILYYTGLSSFIQYKEQMIHKMRKVFAVFAEYKEDIAVIWKPHTLIETTLEQINPELYEQYCTVKQEYLTDGAGILDESSKGNMAIEVCNAYYGDASPLIQMCRNMGKPVMLQVVEEEC